jgi:glycosyltransferase involved in cell wall biosynthesis
VRTEVWDKLIDYENMHVPLGISKKYDICNVAYLRSRKRHDVLVRAMARLADRDLSCVVVGNDPKQYRGKANAFPEELRDLARRLDVRVDFVGEVTKDRVNEYVNQSRIGVICSRKDAAPRAMLEYMAADVPVLVASDLYAGTRYVGPSAGIVRPIEEFHTGIVELLENLDRYAPRAHLLEHYSSASAGDKMVGILERAGLLEGRAA